MRRRVCVVWPSRNGETCLEVVFMHIFNFYAIILCKVFWCQRVSFSLSCKRVVVVWQSLKTLEHVQHPSLTDCCYTQLCMCPANPHEPPTAWAYVRIYVPLFLQVKHQRELHADDRAAMLEIIQSKGEELLRREEEGKTMRLLYESEVIVFRRSVCPSIPSWGCFLAVVAVLGMVCRFIFVPCLGCLRLLW